MPGSVQPPTADADLAAFRSMFELSGAYLARLDAAGQVVEANPEFTQMFGHDDAPVCGQAFERFLAAEARQRFRDAFVELLWRQRDRFSDTFATQMPDGDSGPTGRFTVVALRRKAGQLATAIVDFEPDLQPEPAPVRSLSRLGAKVLEGIAEGATTLELAHRWHLSMQGIEYHVASMLRRFGVPNRAALVARAYATGVLTDAWPPVVAPSVVKD